MDWQQFDVAVLREREFEGHDPGWGIYGWQRQPDRWRSVLQSDWPHSNKFNRPEVKWSPIELLHDSTLRICIVNEISRTKNKSQRKVIIIDILIT